LAYGAVGHSFSLKTQINAQEYTFKKEPKHSKNIE